MGKFIDMTGWIMSEHGVPDSRITVINRAKNMGKQTAWHCKCSCGNLVDIRGDQLRSGVAKSCGCLQREISAKKCRIIGKNNLGKPKSNARDLIGQTFNKLTVIDYAGLKNHRKYWNCECECGHDTIVETSKLLSGHTKSCGCLKSSGENKLKEIFDKNKITYSSQFVFNDLVDKGKLKFDFAIFKDNSLYCLIEYQGQQHYQDNLTTWNSPKEHDKMKREYCEQHNITLIEIPYTDYNILNWNYIKEKCNL